MRKAALIAIVSIGFGPAALLAQQPGQPQERPLIPAEAEATLADCQVWVDHLGEILDADDASLDEDLRSEAEEARDRAAQACDDGDYHHGIQTASEAVDRLEDAVGDEGEPGVNGQ